MARPDRKRCIGTRHPNQSSLCSTAHRVTSNRSRIITIESYSLCDFAKNLLSTLSGGLEQVFVIEAELAAPSGSHGGIGCTEREEPVGHLALLGQGGDGLVQGRDRVGESRDGAGKLADVGHDVCQILC